MPTIPLCTPLCRRLLQTLPALLAAAALPIAAHAAAPGERDAQPAAHAAELAERFATQLTRCFADEVDARIWRDADDRIAGLSGACLDLPARIDDDAGGGEPIVARLSELLPDPSMTGARFRVRAAGVHGVDASRVAVTVRYFRSNGAPYEIDAVLQPATTRLGWLPISATPWSLQGRAR